MESAGHLSTGRTKLPSPPRSMRVVVTCVELGLAALLAYFLAQFSFALLAVDPPLERPLPRVQVSNLATASFDGLTDFDPFFRELQGAQVAAQAAVRESSLRLEVFGLRAEPDGRGTAIIKAQDGEQRLIRVGDRVAAGVTLAAVFPDRLEVNRAGIREAIYLRPQKERSATPLSPPRAASTLQAGSPMAPQFDLAGFGLTPVRRERRVIGFLVPNPLPLPLMGSGLEAGDILTHANGEPLVSFERLLEIGEGLSGAQKLALEIERRGERRNLTLSLANSSINGSANDSASDLGGTR